MLVLQAHKQNLLVYNKAVKAALIPLHCVYLHSYLLCRQNTLTSKYLK